jgi:hypothetical protein
MDAVLADLDVDADQSDAEMEDAEVAEAKEEKKEKKEASMAFFCQILALVCHLVG